MVMNRELTNDEYHIIADFLEEFSDLLASQGCNDHWIPDTDENWELINKVQRWNSSDPEGWDIREQITSDRGLFISNFILPYYFADKLREMLAARKSDE